jgi:hypothetical protein
MVRKLLIFSLGLVPVPASFAADRVEHQDMRQAIAFERHKEEAAAHQARIERGKERAQSRADRSAGRTPRQGRTKSSRTDSAAPPPRGKTR